MKDKKEPKSVKDLAGDLVTNLTANELTELIIHIEKLTK